MTGDRGDLLASTRSLRGCRGCWICGRRRGSSSTCSARCCTWHGRGLTSGCRRRGTLCRSCCGSPSCLLGLICRGCLLLGSEKSRILETLLLEELEDVWDDEPRLVLGECHRTEVTFEGVVGRFLILLVLEQDVVQLGVG